MNDNLKLICAQCGCDLGVFVETPRTANYSECKIRPVEPVLSLVPGSTQICPLCGKYLLLQNQTRPCRECGTPINLPPGGVMTNQGPLSEVVEKQLQAEKPVMPGQRPGREHKGRKEDILHVEPGKEDSRGDSGD